LQNSEGNSADSLLQPADVAVASNAESASDTVRALESSAQNAANNLASNTLDANESEGSVGTDSVGHRTGTSDSSGH